MIRDRASGGWLLLALALVPVTSSAFTPELHERSATGAQRVAAVADGPLDVPRGDGAGALAAGLWRVFASTADDALRSRFLARFPDERSFDAAALKGFLFLNRTRGAWGIDRFEGAPDTLVALRSRAARWPDDDDRNADRFQLDPDGRVRTGPDGRPLPEDPAILEMGGLEGVSSQAHARYALLPASERTDSLEVLEREPWRFSLPRDAHAFGGAFASTYAALAELVRANEPAFGAGAAWMAAAFEGLSWHHVQEAATQTQTVQVPSGDLFLGAQFSVWVEELRSAGGLFAARVSVRDVGVRALTHFHLFHERLFADVLLGCGGTCGDPAVLDAWRALEEVDAAFAAQLDALPAGTALPGAAVGLLVEAGAREAKEIHDHVRGLADPSIFAWRGREVTDADDPLAFLAAPVQELARTPAWRGLFEVRARAFRRFNAYVTRRLASPAADTRALRDGLLRDLLDRHEELEARRAAWVPRDDAPSGLNKGVVAGLASLLVLAALALRSLLRRREPPRAPRLLEGPAGG